MENKIIFIGGPGRSGTTITRKVLEKHSKISGLPFESRFVIDSDGIIDFYLSYAFNWSPYLADRKIKRLENFLLDLSRAGFLHKLIQKAIKKISKQHVIISPKAYADWELFKYFPNFEKSVNELIGELREFSFPGVWFGAESYRLNPKIYYGKPRSPEELAAILGKFMRKIIDGLLKKAGADAYIDDNPWNFLSIASIFEVLPEAKLIHVLRDPRDVVASLCCQSWAPKKLNEAIIFYKDIIQRWLSVKNKILDGSYYEFKLEELVSNPESTVKGICAFMGVLYESKMIDIDLSKSHSGRWKRQFNEDEKKLLEKELKEIIIKLGYK